MSDIVSVREEYVSLGFDLHKTIDLMADEITERRGQLTVSAQWLAGLMSPINEILKTQKYKEALEKISDPRKRDHKEPDAYTELGCVMNIASEALK